MIRLEIKQMYRTPVRTAFFFLMIFLSGVLLSSGVIMWYQNKARGKLYEESFSTVGTVTQLQVNTKETRLWDAALGDYRLYRGPEYSGYFPLSILDFEGSNYLKAPEFRPYFRSYAPEYRLREDQRNMPKILIAELTPLEDCIPNQSVQVQITRFLCGGNYPGYQEGMTIWFCCHNDPDPPPMYAGKTYVAVLASDADPHGAYAEMMDMGAGESEYSPVLLASSQRQMDGRYAEGLYSAENMEGKPSFYEVTEDFYDSGMGACYLNAAKAADRYEHSIYATGTSGTDLLMPFYEGSAYFYEGRDISEEEYREGKKVCLISRSFAEDNSLELGQTVTLRLYTASYGMTASEAMGMIAFYELLNAQGLPYEIFEEDEWEIVGIYDVEPAVIGSEYGLADGEIIFPSRSVTNSWDLNIVTYGYFSGNTVSFQIPNGQIEEFMKGWNQAGTEELEIVFYDKGYSQLEKGMENREKLSLLLTGTGCAMTVILLLAFAYLYVEQRKMYVAVERALGMKKYQCAIGLNTGLMLLLVLGCILGCMAGGIVVQYIPDDFFQKVYFDTLYSSGLSDYGDSVDLASQGISMKKTAELAWACAVSMMLLGECIIAVHMKRVLKMEPMELLGHKNNGG